MSPHLEGVAGKPVGVRVPHVALKQKIRAPQSRMPGSDLLASQLTEKPMCTISLSTSPLFGLQPLWGAERPQQPAR
jgi:hypothetical protein